MLPQARLEFIAFERAATVLGAAFFFPWVEARNRWSAPQTAKQKRWRGSRVSYRAPAPLPAALAALSPSNTTVFLTVPGVADTCVLLILGGGGR